MPSGAGIDISPPEFFEWGLAGLAYNTGRGPLTNPAGQTFRATFGNPLGSGKLMLFHRLRFFSSGVNEFIDVQFGPTANLPTFALPTPSQRTGKPQGLAQVFMDIGALAPSGGAVASFRLPIQPEDSLVEFLSYPTAIFDPGMVMALYTTNSSGGDVQLTMIFDWFEVDFLP